MTATVNSKPYGIIYCITNKVNGKRYIGQTTMPLYKRWHAHKKANGRCISIAAAIKKYGVDAFEIIEIDRAFSREELDEKEVAKLLVFLAGEDAGYITGQVFGVNGGLVI